MPGHDYRSTADLLAAQKNMANDKANSALFQALMQQQLQGKQHQTALQMQGQQAKDLADYKDVLGQKAIERNMDTAADFSKSHPGMGVTIGENGNVALSKPVDTGAVADRHERLVGSQANDYSKKLEHTLGFADSLRDLEAVTNKLSGGKGGILTNPNYKPLSGGYLASFRDHPEVLSAMESVGAVPKGTLEEAKAIARFQLQYQQSMTGMRTTEEMAKREAASMGATSSGDPTLLSKGIRALANLARNKIQVQQSPYSREALDRVHSSMGNPLEVFPKVYDDNVVGEIAQQPPQKPVSGLGSIISGKNPTPAMAGATGKSASGGYGGILTPKAPQQQKAPSTGPYGDSVKQDGITYKWNPNTNNYE